MLVRALYTLVLALVSPLLLWGLYRKRPNKPAIGKRWKEHWGFTPATSFNKPLWIHAVSVGEVLAVSPLIRELKRQSPAQPIVLTTTTSTGAEQAEKLGDLVEHRYMPVDFSHCVRRFLATVAPQALVIVETELWPNTLHTVHQAGIPITVINARLSARSAKGYQRVKPLFNIIAKTVDQILCLHQDDAHRFVQLGVSDNKVTVSGSIKYDLTISPNTIAEGNALRETLGSTRPVWIAASTHKGEDEKMLRIHRQVLAQYPDAILILVPRHPERFDDVAALCLEEGFTAARRSVNPSINSDTQIYLGDTMGELLVMQQSADITVMGGSLIGDKVGGHNLLEPAALGKPSLIGPSFFNFTDVTLQLSDAGATIIAQSEADIASQLLELLQDTEKCDAMASTAKAVVKANQGAMAFTIERILKQVG
uniref:lipid IV(A) 3-deoxy-D-manno-octulosonic acid transferase n=1 Tax=Thaumasiovibrio occultus TaxID=1891184 RepID=UPI000B359495|nr:lipid IV(A) 3-deoxy-D-manno-octulosonic acid transferase [Thaumasiovibrio occultus]